MTIRTSRRGAVALCTAAITALWLAASVLAGEAAPAKEKGKPEPARPLTTFDVIKHVDPFSPDPPKEPAPPSPPPGPPPAPPKKVRVAPDNLHVSGVTWDKVQKALTALVEVEGAGPRFLGTGAKVGHWEVVGVDAAGIEVKAPDGALRKIALGTRFHDGVTFIERLEGGEGSAQPPPAAPAAAAEAPAAGPALDEAKRKEIIERLKAKRAAGGGK
jgi:hypothetical protein